MIVFLGDDGVGKSTIKLWFVQGCFVANCDPTLEDSYGRVVMVDSEEILVDITEVSSEAFPVLKKC